MKRYLYSVLLLCGLGCSGLSVANDKVQSMYNAKQFQKVCQGKTQSTAVSFAYRGIIWNGTCEPQFFPNQTKHLKGDEAQLNTICQTDPATTSINIEGQTYQGKCALGFTPPTPKR